MGRKNKRKTGLAKELETYPVIYKAMRQRSWFLIPADEWDTTGAKYLIDAPIGKVDHYDVSICTVDILNSFDGKVFAYAMKKVGNYNNSQIRAATKKGFNKLSEAKDLAWAESANISADLELNEILDYLGLDKNEARNRAKVRDSMNKLLQLRINYSRTNPVNPKKTDVISVPLLSTFQYTVTRNSKGIRQLHSFKLNISKEFMQVVSKGGPESLRWTEMQPPSLSGDIHQLKTYVTMLGEDGITPTKVIDIEHLMEWTGWTIGKIRKRISTLYKDTGILYSKKGLEYILQ